MNRVKNIEKSLSSLITITDQKINELKKEIRKSAVQLLEYIEIKNNTDVSTPEFIEKNNEELSIEIINNIILCYQQFIELLLQTHSKTISCSPINTILSDCHKKNIIDINEHKVLLELSQNIFDWSMLYESNGNRCVNIYLIDGYEVIRNVVLRLNSLAMPVFLPAQSIEAITTFATTVQH